MTCLYDVVLEAINLFEESDELYSDEYLKLPIDCADIPFSEQGFDGVLSGAGNLLIHTANAVSLLMYETVDDDHALYRLSCIKRELYEMWDEGDVAGAVQANVPSDFICRFEDPDAEYAAE